MIRFYVRTKTRKNQISLNRLKNILPVNRLAHREGVKVEIKKTNDYQILFFFISF